MICVAQEEVNLKPVSMYAITTKLFTHLETAIRTQFPDEATGLLHEGIDGFVTELNHLVQEVDAHYVIDDKAIFSIEKLKNEEKLKETYKNYITTQEEVGVKEPLSIYAMMAKMFAHVTKVVVDRYGEIGEETIKRGVETFGNERGQHIARRAASVGKENTLENYLSHYDMGRSELFEYETIYHADQIEQTFTKCAFGHQWKADGTGEYGILYCEMIDPSIAKGYNPNFEVVHDEYILKEGCCHFLFQLKEE